MKSIKYKFFLMFTVTFVVMIILFITINTSFLKTYYIYDLEKDMVRYYNAIENEESIDAALRYLTILTRNKGVYSMIIDSENNIQFDSLQIRSNQGNGQMGLKKMKTVPSYIIDVLSSYENETDKNYYYDTVKAEGNKEDVVYMNEWGEGYYIIMYKTVGNIETNVAIANRFFVLVSIGLTIIGGVIIFAFSKKVTKPIIELKEITEKIAEQDFSHKFKVETEDELGQLGANINQMSDKLDEAMTSLKEDIRRKEAIDDMRKGFISNVSHELKTPIGLIKGYIEGIKFGVYDSEEEKRQYYDVIINEADKMNKMIYQLLALSTMDSEADELNLTVFNVAVLIDEIVLKFKKVFEDQHIILIRDTDYDFFIKADYLKIEQVITNYLTNAINHIDQMKEIRITLKNLNNKVKVSVYNSGKNIPLSETENIWESFYKVDKARTREYGGTGLGLSIVRVIMEKHGGKYGFTNYDKGVEFWFEVDEYVVEEG